MIPLEIKLHIATPVAQAPYKKSFPLHLDSLLINLLAREQKRVYPINPLEEFNDPFSPEKKALPVAVVGKEKPVYCASVAFCQDTDYDLYSFTRKPPEIEVWNMTKNKKFVQGGEETGKKKGILETINIVHPKLITFQCIGDKLALHDILKGVNNIGHKRNVGFGEVYDIEINEIDNKYAGLITYNGLPARALPCIDWPEKEGWTKLRMAYKAPYWEPANIDLCWMPDPERAYPRVG